MADPEAIVAPQAAERSAAWPCGAARGWAHHQGEGTGRVLVVIHWRVCRHAVVSEAAVRAEWYKYRQWEHLLCCCVAAPQFHGP